MDKLILIVGGVVVLILIILIVVLSSSGKKGPKKKKKHSKIKSSIEIDPEAIVSRIFKLAPSELKQARLEYYGRTVEIRTIMNSSKTSKKGDPYREVLLDYQDNRNIHIIGDLNMNDYDDQSWMTREGKLRIRGTLKEIQPKEFYVDDIKIV